MNQIDSAVCEKLHSACLRHEPFGHESFDPELTTEGLTAEGFGSKARDKSKPVWIIGAWNLDIVCYL